MENSLLLELCDLWVSFSGPEGEVQALRGLSLAMAPGEILGLVGESGSGKSTAACAVPGMLPPSGRIVQGKIFLNGQELTALSPRQLARVRGREIGMIFQDPFASLDPLYTVGSQLCEVIRCHDGCDKVHAMERGQELLKAVGIPDPQRQMRLYPHQLSGGLCQRVMIALALAGRPRLLIADEATSALDVTTQAQILELLSQLRRELGMGILLITHDLRITARICDRVAVLYGGRLAECGPAKEILSCPTHPYSRALLRCIPALTAHSPQRPAFIPGQPPDPFHPPAGCAFAERCPHAMKICLYRQPPLGSESPSHMTACWLMERGAGTGTAVPNHSCSQI